MVAYLPFTNEYWVEAVRKLEVSDSINFWSPTPRPLLREIEGVMLYFYATHGGGPQRYIVGRGRVQSFRVGTVEEAWERYERGNGAAALRIFLKRLNEGQSATELVRETSRIGWHILDEMTWRSTPLDIRDLDIPILLGTWRGRKLKPPEEQRIIRDLNWGFSAPVL